MNKIQGQELIYGGPDQGFVFDMKLENNQNEKFLYIIENNSFKNLKEKISIEDFNFIKKDLHILHRTETREFKEDLKSGIVKEVGKEFYNYYEIEKSNLSLYYYIEKDKYIHIYSFGETQPCLYKLYLEGVYEL